MSIASALTALSGDITAARAAVAAKGGTVTVDGGSSQLAGDIASIPSGGTPQRTAWYRPPDWPDLTSMEITDDDEVFLTLDTGTEDSGRALGLYLNMRGFTTKVERGHIENHRFVVDERYGKQGDYHFHYRLPDNVGRYVVIRVSSMNSEGFGGAKYYGEFGAMNIVEVLGNTTKRTKELFANEVGDSTIKIVTNRKGEILDHILNSQRIEFVDFSECVPVNVVNLYGALSLCTSLTNFILPSTPLHVSRISYFLYGAKMLRSLDMSQIILDNIETSVINVTRDMALLETVKYGPWDLSETTSLSSSFTGLYNLKNITCDGMIYPKLSFGYNDSAFLTDTSLINIANALPVVTASTTLTLHATPKARLSTIMGTVAEGVFTADESGTVSLQDFITTTKGWTVA